MPELKLNEIIVTDAAGVVRTDVPVTLSRRNVQGASVWFAGAVCPGGFDPDCAVVLRPEWPFGAGSRWMAIENHSPFWCRPRFGTDPCALPARVQELLVEENGRYAAFLPLVGDTFKTLIRGSEHGAEIYLYANAPVTECRDQPCLVAAEADDPLRAARAAAAAAAEVLGLPLRGERPVSPVFDTFGWCSWDALQIRVSHAGLMEKAAEFREKKVPVGFAIIDDMWADVPDLCGVPEDIEFGAMVKIMHASKLRSFAGAPNRFPQGMAAAIADLHGAGIANVGVWFPTTGYWSGLLPGGEAEAREAEHLITTENGQRIVAPEPEKAAAYFDDLCADVKAWGGDFVKIDNQGFHKRYRGVTSIGQSSAAIQTAIDRAADKHFGGALINCMGMPSECMFHRRSAVSRCSDDFMPESPAWFSKNILQCSYNGLLQGQFYVNDWDMWWTDDAQARKNSLCRAVSGGPVYVSDKIGRTRPEILAPLVLSDGSILRCDESATPTADCVMGDPTEADAIFKIRNRKGGAALVAAFNIHRENRPVRGFVSAENAGLPRGETAYYEFFTGESGILAPGEALPVALADNGDFRLYTFVPMPESGVAALGRLDLFIGVGAVRTDGKTVTVREGGEVGFISRESVALRGARRVTRSGLLTRAVTAAGKNVTLEIL